MNQALSLQDHFRQLSALLNEHAGLWRPVPFCLPVLPWESEHPDLVRGLATLKDDKLAALGAGALLRALPNILSGQPAPVPQDPEGACYASKLDKAEARIDWMDSAGAIWLRIRAFNPWPVAETRWLGRQLRVWMARPVDGGRPGPPGQVIEVNRDSALVVTGEGIVRLERLQLPGGRVLPVAEFLKSNDLTGARLGQ